MPARRLSALTADKLAHARSDASRLPCLSEVSDRLPLMMEHQVRKHNVARGCRYWPGGLSACHEFRQLAFEHDHAGLAGLRIDALQPDGVTLDIFPCECLDLILAPATQEAEEAAIPQVVGQVCQYLPELLFVEESCPSVRLLGQMPDDGSFGQTSAFNCQLVRLLEKLRSAVDAGRF